MKPFVDGRKLYNVRSHNDNLTVENNRSMTDWMNDT